VVGEIKGRSARPGKLPMLIDLAFPTTFDETIPSFFPFHRVGIYPSDRGAEVRLMATKHIHM
jgi:hypothetical protein